MATNQFAVGGTPTVAAAPRMTSEQLDAIGNFLKTNPSQQALSAAMQQFGVGQADVDLARGRVSAAPPANQFVVGGTPTVAAAPAANQFVVGGTPTVGSPAPTPAPAPAAANPIRDYAQTLSWAQGNQSDQASSQALYKKAIDAGWDSKQVAQSLGLDPAKLAQQWQGYTLSNWGGNAGSSPAASPTGNSPFAVGGSATTSNLGMGSSANTANRAAVMPPETTGQRGMQQYNPGMGNTVDRAAVMPNEYNTGQRGMQPYNPGMGAQGMNPYLNQMASGMTGQVRQNFLQQTMPQLRSGAQASGQYGGSRQGIAEGVAAGNAATGLAGQLANLYGGAYNTDQANQTQRYGTNVGAGVSMRGQDVSQNIAGMNNQTTQMGQAQQYGLGLGQLGLGFQNAANNYNLGLGQLDLSNQGQNQNFYTSQRGQDLQQYQLGANLYGNGVNGQIGVGQGQYNVGQQYQNAPINAINQYGQAISPYTGYGQTQTTSGQAGGGANGVVGGGLAGAQIANNLWRGSQGNTAMINGGGFSNFPAYMYQGN